MSSSGTVTTIAVRSDAPVRVKPTPPGSRVCIMIGEGIDMTMVFMSRDQFTELLEQGAPEVGYRARENDEQPVAVR